MTSFSHDRNYSSAMVVAVVFLCMQVAAIAHAASYGDDHHTHDGAPCSFLLLSDAPTTPAICCSAFPVRLSSGLRLAAQFDRLSSVHLDHSRAIRGPPVLSD